MLAVFELKSDLSDPAGLIAQLDRYRRLAPGIAEGRGWQAGRVSCPDSDHFRADDSGVEEFAAIAFAVPALSRGKKGPANVFTAVDIPSLAIMMGATYVGRSFSGDRKQLTPLIKGALNHRGTAILDVLSPCVTFNDHDGSTKSLKNIRANRDALNEVEFTEEEVPNTEHHKEGTDLEIGMHGGVITLHKLKDHDPRDRMAALQRLDEAQHNHKFLTGLLYINEDRPDLAEIENLCDTPLAYLDPKDLRPPKDALEKINAALML